MTQRSLPVLICRNPRYEGLQLGSEAGAGEDENAPPLSAQNSSNSQNSLAYADAPTATFTATSQGAGGIYKFSKNEAEFIFVHSPHLRAQEWGESVAWFIADHRIDLTEHNCHFEVMANGDFSLVYGTCFPWPSQA